MLVTNILLNDRVGTIRNAQALAPLVLLAVGLGHTKLRTGRPDRLGAMCLESCDLLQYVGVS